MNNLYKAVHKKRTKQAERDLTSRVSSVIAIIGLAGSIFFLSSNITGNVIGNMTNSTSNTIGVVLLVIGLIAGFFWIRNRKK